MGLESFLEDIGFTKAEASVYLALQKVGESKSGQIIKTTGLQSSVVHNALNTLIEKGFISYVKKGEIKHYLALSPKIISNYLKSKQRDFENIIPEIEVLNQDTKKIPVVEIFTDFKGLFAANLKLIEESKKGDLLRFFAFRKPDLSEEFFDFFEKLNRMERDKGIMVRGIEQKNSVLKQNQTHAVIRISEQETPSEMTIFKDKIIMYSFVDKPVAILIHSKEIAKQYSRLWDAIWESSAPKVK